MIAYFETWPEGVRENGVWIVYTHPSSYSEQEKAALTEVVAECARKKIPLFTCQASDLDKKAWKEGGTMK